MALAFGAILGGKMLNNGRRSPMILMNIVGIVGSLMSVVPNYYVLVAGRGLYCLSAGVLIAAVPRILEETIPAEKYDLGFGASTNLAIDALIFINTIIVMFMPKPLLMTAKPVPTPEDISNNTTSMNTSHLWKYLFLIPVPLLSISLFISVCCFRNETVGFLVSKGKK
jgi:MFS family permease